MKKETTTIGQVIVSMFTLLWIYTAISKLGNLPITILQMQKQPLPVWSTEVLAVGLPILELGTATLLNIQATKTLALTVSTVLLSLFSLYIVYVLSLDRKDIPCSCGGVIQGLSWKTHLGFNLFWLIICIVGLIKYKRSPSKVANTYTGSPLQI